MREPLFSNIDLYDMINEIIENKQYIEIYLVNGVKLDGILLHKDKENKCIVMKKNNIKQFVFLHSVSTIVLTTKKEEN